MNPFSFHSRRESALSRFATKVLWRNDAPSANVASGLFPLLALSILITGCKVGPNYKRPVVATPADYRGALAPEITPGALAGITPLGAQKWDTVFTDPALQTLIAEALKNNYDVKIAADRVLEEQAAVGVTRAGEFPTLTGGASYDAISLPGGLLSGLTSNNNNNNGSGSNSSNNNSRTNVYSGGFTASAAWNLDFWGQYRRMTEAQRAEYRATQWAQQTTYSTIVEDVATGYYQLLTLDAELAVTKQTIIARQQSVDLTRRLEQGGAKSLADVRQAEELLYTATAQLPDLQRQITQAENNLAIVLGRNPGPIARPTVSVPAQVSADGTTPVANNLASNDDTRPAKLDSAYDLHFPHPIAVPVGLPSELLERRPDIRRAEELLIQANANIGVARAQFFPSLSLSATAGTSSSQLKKIVDSGNIYYYAVGSLSQPIFDAGKIRSNYKEAKAKDQELLHTYQQTIAGAMRDVSNALTAYTRTRQYREQQEKQTAASADAVRLARLRYNGGSTSYLEVLTTDATLYQSQLSLEAAQQQEALALVQLYNALGGGW
jgi:multidrug efflux system outer membrane protein